MRTSHILRHEVGQFYEEHFEITNNLPLWRVWLELVDHSGISPQNRVKVFSMLAPKKIRTYNTYTLLTHRGAFKLGPLQLVSGDPFGFFTAEQWIPPRSTLVVMPYLVDIDNFAFTPGYLTGGNILRKATTETTPYAAGVREYEPGDPLNRIHWPSTARREKLMVKEFDQDPQTNAWIFLDAQASQHYEYIMPVRIEDQANLLLLKQKFRFELPCSTLEYAVSVSASLLKYFIRQGYAVGLATAGKTIYILPAERGDRQLSKLLEILAFVKPDGDLPLFALVENQVKNLPRGSTLVLITPSRHPSLGLALDIALSRGLKPAVVMIDAASFGKENAEGINEQEILARNVPIKTLKFSDDLKTALETPVVQRPPFAI